ncbi:alternative ribosome rescue aminoacyl-tRNA hydrolase ArfB [soil metagenome]
MSEEVVLSINDDLFIPRAELSFRASRAGGPGGQHVNTSSTRVELVWSVESSPSLSEAQRARIQDKLANRINAAGELLLAEGGSRSQHQNREAVVERLRDLLSEALHIPKPRRKTRPTRASKERRLQTKKRRSEVKKMRGPIRPE